MVHGNVLVGILRHLCCARPRFLQLRLAPLNNKVGSDDGNILELDVNSEEEARQQRRQLLNRLPAGQQVVSPSRRMQLPYELCHFMPSFPYYRLAGYVDQHAQHFWTTNGRPSV